MKTALHLLLETDESIATISDMLEFSAPGHFTRFFAKHTDETPMSYRTRNLAIESLSDMNSGCSRFHAGMAAR
jgi:AraC-like DNA-binding protein